MYILRWFKESEIQKYKSSNLFSYFISSCSIISSVVDFSSHKSDTWELNVLLTREYTNMNIIALKNPHLLKI